jgi:phospholipid/cholesterol/gamma-HCH transport system substrate-binding protein
MTKERNAFKAGLFILITILLIVGIVVSIKGVGRFTEARQWRTASFRLTDDIGGLRQGDEVRVGGYRVGNIRSIEPVDLDTPNARLLVTFDLPERFKFHADARVGVQTTLTGTSVLNVESLGTGPMLADGQALAGRPDPKSSLLASLSGVGEDVSAITKDVRNNTLPRVNSAVDTFKKTGDEATVLIKHVDGKVDPAVEKYKEVADKTGGMMTSIRDMVGPSTKDFHGTMADLHEITSDVKEKLPGMLTRVQSSLDGVEKSIGDVQKTVANTRDISDNVKQVIGGNRGKLDGIVASIKTTGDNLKAASSEIRRSPWRLLYQPKQDELSNLNLYDSARQFAEGANELNDAAQALRDAVNSKESDPQQLQKLVNRLEKSFSNFHDVEDKLWRGVKE